MTDFEGELHPTLSRIHRVHSAGAWLGDALEMGLVKEGSLSGGFTSWKKADPAYVISRLDVYNEKTRINAIFAFAPPAEEASNPMMLIEFDDEDPDNKTIIPVLARVLLKSNTPITEAAAGTRMVPVTNVMLSLTSDTSILSYDETINAQPLIGTFDGVPYRKIDTIIDMASPLQDLLEFAEAHG